MVRDGELRRADAPPLVRLEQVASTQDEAHRLAEAGAPAGAAVVAREQTAGRGRRGRAWTSGAGGLWLSVLARPRRAATVEVLSVRVGLALARALEEASGVASVGLKWPNDLLVGDRKVGGILCEARWQGELLAWVVVGVGINVANRPPDDARLPATALGEHRPGLAPGALLEPVLAAVRGAIAVEGPLGPHELAAIAARDRLRGRRLLEPVAGTADGIEPDGALRVIDDAGAVTLVRAGTVVPADAGAGRRD